MAENAQTTGLTLDGDGAVFRQIERALRGRIARGVWQPGDRLPSEQQLVRELGVSRMTVNRALAALADDGLLVRRRRAGTVVAAQSRVLAAFAIPDIREEVLAAGRKYAFRLTRRAVRRATAADRTRLEVPAGTRVLWLQGIHSGDGQPEIFEERLIDADLLPDAQNEEFSEIPPGSWLLARVSWTRVAFAISAVNADRVLARHLGVSTGAAVLAQDRRTWRDKAPVTWVRLCFRTDRHVFSGEFAP
ncbi:MAG: UTRA domain-containing protein [Proteobacteria bacterium]|nr:UTRA domain-containing protein [Pseudomonadota bacterium]